MQKNSVGGGDAGGYPGLFRALSIIWLIQYLGARMLPMPVMVYVFYQSDWSSMPVNDLYYRLQNTVFVN